VWAFKSLEARKAQKGKLCSFCKRSLGKKVLQDMLLKALKFKILKKANFSHFVSHPLDEKKFADPKRQTLLIL